MKKDERYKYTGMPLTGKIAAKILFEWTETTERPISVWMEIVSTHHISCGGLPAKGNSEQIIREALSILRRFGRAESSGQWWTIRTKEKSDTLKNSADDVKKESTKVSDKGYEYQGKPLTHKIALEIIFKRYAGESPISFKTILEKVSQYHEHSGGLPPEDQKHLPWIIHRALSHLKRRKCATPMNRRRYHTDDSWRIHEEDIHYDERDYPKTIGEGNGSVYLYYYPIYKRDASFQRQRFWKCKIGGTKRDAVHRTKEQVKTGLPEHAITALTIKTDEPAVLEKKIQDILKILGKYAEDAPGTEWFFTAPSEVESIYEFICLHSS